MIGHVLVGMWSFSAVMPREPVSEAIKLYVQNLLGESLDPDVQRFDFIGRLFSWVAFPFVLFLRLHHQGMKLLPVHVPPVETVHDHVYL